MTTNRNHAHVIKDRDASSRDVDALDDRPLADRLAEPLDSPIPYTLDERAAYVPFTPSAAKETDQ